MKLLIARSALNDLEDIRRYYSNQGLTAVGQEIVSMLLAKAQRLIEHPDVGRKVPEFDQAQIREIIHSPFRVVYLREAEVVNLVRVFRSERLLVLPEG